MGPRSHGTPFRERIYSPKSEYAHVTCDTSRGYPTNEEKIFTTFCKKEKKEVMQSLAPALTLTLTLTLSLNHLANKQLRSTNGLYSLINGIARRITNSSLLISKFWRNSDVICYDAWLPYSDLCEQILYRSQYLVTLVTCSHTGTWYTRILTVNFCVPIFANWTKTRNSQLLDHRN